MNYCTLSIMLLASSFNLYSNLADNPNQSSTVSPQSSVHIDVGAEEKDFVHTFTATSRIKSGQKSAHTSANYGARSSMSIAIDVPEGDFIHRDQLQLSSDHPHVEIISWLSSIDPVTKYDPVFKEDKKVFDRPFTIEVMLSNTAPAKDAAVHVSYYRHATQALEEQLISIRADNNATDNASVTTVAIDVEQTPVYQEEADHSNNSVADEKNTGGFACYVQDMVEKTDAIWLRILLVLLLGLLMSLTPCIYPMIPITMGILQSQGSTSMGRNFLLASCYSAGIATMFALLGLLAASTGQLFGAVMAHPAVIISIVLLLAYLAGSMLGLYEMYVPRFMTANNNRVKSGSLISVFLFGFVSGSVASPCLSPGLILLLTIVTGLKSMFLGFILLFAFGIGLSIPLLIVGTFSSALNTLPRAGMWMVEIKKLFGVVMIGMCFYFLHMVVVPYVLWALSAVSALFLGIFYMYHEKHSTGLIKRINFIFGGLLLTSVVFLCVQTYKAYVMHTTCPVSHDHIWIADDYSCAREKAIAQNKPLLMKVGGPCCSLCTAIDNKQFAHMDVIRTIEESMVAVKINGALMNPDITHIKETYTIHGFPTILVINPHNESVIKQWAGELYDVNPALFAQDLKKCAQQCIDATK